MRNSEIQAVRDKCAKRMGVDFIYVNEARILLEALDESLAKCKKMEFVIKKQDNSLTEYLTEKTRWHEKYCLAVAEHESMAKAHGNDLKALGSALGDALKERDELKLRAGELELMLGLRNTPANTALDDWYKGKEAKPDA